MGGSGVSLAQAFRFGLVGVLVAAGLAKVLGVAFEVQAFAGAGAPDWLRIAFGWVQALGAVLLVSPRTTPNGVTVQGLLALGAFGALATRLDPLALAPAALGVALGMLLWLTRRELAPPR
jgi:hypothetical protein